ncbi:MAG: hypothetical protein QW244_02070 [Candidatus Pacearchaeota archaeon]
MAEIKSKIKSKGKIKKIKKEKKGKKSIDEVKKGVYEVGEYLMGEVGSKITDILYGKKNVNEFLIEKKTKIPINQIRNLLYRLLNKNIISSIRKKDKKKGWYVYYWTLHNEKALEALKEIKVTKLHEIEGEIKSKQNITFYSCSKGCSVMKEETALLHDFFCPECGELMQPLSMENEIKKLSLAKENVAKEIEKIDFLIQTLKEKAGRERERKAKRERMKMRKESERVKKEHKKQRKLKKIKIKVRSKKKGKKIKKRIKKVKK